MNEWAIRTGDRHTLPTHGIVVKAMEKDNSSTMSGVAGRLGSWFDERRLLGLHVDMFDWSGTVTERQRGREHSYKQGMTSEHKVYCAIVSRCIAPLARGDTAPPHVIKFVTSMLLTRSFSQMCLFLGHATLSKPMYED